jgi:hypothetical protein
MGNRRKTREQRLRQTVRNNPRKRQSANEELSRIDMLKQYAVLQGYKVKES